MKKNKKSKKGNVVLMGFLVVLAILTGYGTARANLGINNMLDKMDRDIATGLETVDVDTSKLNSDNKIVNVLLVGADKRESWKEAGRSDSCMIATLDLKHKKLKLTSLMRDMYVTIPGYKDNRFNAAYSYGGVSLLYQTIANNFELKLDGYVVVDFAAFKKVVDTLGGVEITLTKEEAKYLTTAYKKGSVLKLKEGLNNMNGTQALAYSRIRQDKKSDFGRTERQRTILSSIFTKAKKLSFNELVNLCEEILPYLTTDLTNGEIKSYMTSVLTMGTTTIDQFRLPIDGSYTPESIRQMDVLVIDIEKNKKALNEFIFEQGSENP